MLLSPLCSLHLPSPTHANCRTTTTIWIQRNEPRGLWPPSCGWSRMSIGDWTLRSCITYLTTHIPVFNTNPSMVVSPSYCTIVLSQSHNYVERRRSQRSTATMRSGTSEVHFRKLDIFHICWPLRKGTDRRTRSRAFRSIRQASMLQCWMDAVFCLTENDLLRIWLIELPVWSSAITPHRS